MESFVIRKSKYPLIVCKKNGQVINLNNIASKLFGLDLNKKLTLRFYNLIDSDFVVEFLKIFNNDTTYASMNIFIKSKSGELVPCKLIMLSAKYKFIKLRFIKAGIKRPKISIIKRFLIITRTKFLIGSILPLIFALFWSLGKEGKTNISYFPLLFVIIIIFHMSANTFNDYFDWISGRDNNNKDYVLFITGGGRSIDLKLISPKNLLRISIMFFIIIFFLSLYFIYKFGAPIIFLGLIGILSVYFYSAPPIHLASRKGLGELMHVICLGPLIILGSTYILNNEFSFVEFFLGIPFGLMITSCLLINEYPDLVSDRKSRKYNLAVTFERHVQFLYFFILFTSAVFICIDIYIFKLSKIFLLPLLIILNVWDEHYKILNLGKSESKNLAACEYSFRQYFHFSLLYILSCIINTSSVAQW